MPGEQSRGGYAQSVRLGDESFSRTYNCVVASLNSSLVAQYHRSLSISTMAKHQSSNQSRCPRREGEVKPVLTSFLSFIAAYALVKLTTKQLNPQLYLSA